MIGLNPIRNLLGWGSDELGNRLEVVRANIAETSSNQENIFGNKKGTCCRLFFGELFGLDF